MKKIYYVLLVVAGMSALVSCDNGNADIVLLDSAPSLELQNFPGTVESSAPLVFSAKMQDGQNQESSLSPLASYNYSITDTTTDVEVMSETASISGLSQTVDFEIPTTDIPVGIYRLTFTATDTKGLNTTTEGVFEVIECGDPETDIGIIGSATEAGWDQDTDMTQDDVNPYMWMITLDLTEGEAKFRADNDWGVNWGAAGFPTGTGEQDGANIGVNEAGTYDVTLNTCTGAYTFTKQ